MRPLPDKSFAEIAVDLKLYADSAVRALRVGEVMQARGGWAGGFDHSLAELKLAAEIAGGLYYFFHDNIAHEADIRAALAAAAVEVASADERSRVRAIQTRFAVLARGLDDDDILQAALAVAVIAAARKAPSPDSAVEAIGAIVSNVEAGIRDLWSDLRDAPQAGAA